MTEKTLRCIVLCVVTTAVTALVCSHLPFGCHARAVPAVLTVTVYDQMGKPFRNAVVDFYGNGHRIGKEDTNADGEVTIQLGDALTEVLVKAHTGFLPAPWKRLKVQEGKMETSLLLVTTCRKFERPEAIAEGYYENSSYEPYSDR